MRSVMACCAFVHTPGQQATLLLGATLHHGAHIVSVFCPSAVRQHKCAAASTATVYPHCYALPSFTHVPAQHDTMQTLPAGLRLRQ